MHGDAAPRPILLVHGAWHGAWCWAALQAELDRRGIASWAVDLPGHGVSTEPLGDLVTDAEPWSAAHGHRRSRGDDGVVLVGHSYGGGVITRGRHAGAGQGPADRPPRLPGRVRPERRRVGHRGVHRRCRARTPPLNGLLQRHDDGTFSAGPVEAAIDVFYGHCTAEQAAAAVARLSRQAMRQPRPAGHRRPRATDRRAPTSCAPRTGPIHPNHQRLMAERCGATVRAGHRPLPVHVDAGRDGRPARRDRRPMSAAHEGPHRLRLRRAHATSTTTASPPSSTRSSGCGFDSLWLCERIGGEAPDPLVAMAFAAGRTTQLKFGMSVMVLPGRNPIVLAKELATLDRLSNGRLLPAFGLGVADPHEQQAFGVRAHRAGARSSTRRWRSSAALDRGRRSPTTARTSTTTSCACCPSRRQHHLDVWLGGIAPSELQARRPPGRRLAAQLRHPGRLRPRPRGDRAGRRRARPVDRRRALRRADPLRQRPDPRGAAGRPGQAPARPRRPVGAGAPGLGRAARAASTGSSPSARPSSSCCRSSEPGSTEAWIAHLEEAAPVVLARQT